MKMDKKSRHMVRRGSRFRDFCGNESCRVESIWRAIPKGDRKRLKQAYAKIIQVEDSDRAATKSFGTVMPKPESTFLTCG